MSTNPFAPRKLDKPGQPSGDMSGTWPNYKEPSTFDWGQVDGAILRAALQCATDQGKSIGIGPAMGGRGVVVTLYMGLKVNPKRFAINAGELHEMLLVLIQAWSSPSEDIVSLMRSTGVRIVEVAAD